MRFQVTPKNADDIQQLYTSLTSPRMPGVNKVIDGKVISDVILRFAHVIEVIFLVAIIILLSSAPRHADRQHDQAVDLLATAARSR